MGCSESKEEDGVEKKERRRRGSSLEGTEGGPLPFNSLGSSLQQEDDQRSVSSARGSVTSSRFNDSGVGNSATMGHVPLTRVNPLLAEGSAQENHENQLGIIGGGNPPESAVNVQGVGEPVCNKAADPPSSQKGVRQLVGNFTVLSTMVSRQDGDQQDLVVRNYKGGFEHPECGTYFPSVTERYTSRIQEVDEGKARGGGGLWMDPNKEFEPVMIDMLKPMNYTLRTPIARQSLLNAINGLRDDLRRIELLIDRPSDFDAALSLGENLYIRSRGNHLPKLTAVFLELFTRVNDMCVLQKNRDEFMGALRLQDVNQYKDTFFATGDAKEDMAVTLDLLDQYLESELSEVIMYCVCVAWTSIDELQNIANGEGA